VCRSPYLLHACELCFLSFWAQGKRKGKGSGNGSTRWSNTPEKVYDPMLIRNGGYTHYILQTSLYISRVGLPISSPFASVSVHDIFMSQLFHNQELTFFLLSKSTPLLKARLYTPTVLSTSLNLQTALHQPLRRKLNHPHRTNTSSADLVHRRPRKTRHPR